MYIARQCIKGKNHFFIRQSYKDGKLLRSRELFHLGPDPSRYIIYPGGNAFYISETVTDALEKLHVFPGPDELDDAFWPFLKPRIRHILEPFRQKNASRTSNKRAGESVKHYRVHPFDKRRICFLKFGRVNERIMARLPNTLLQNFSEKSRDEIEQDFIKQECCLESDEKRTYTYAIFDLQRFFLESFARETPQWLDQQEIEKHFLKEICRMHADRAFWAGKWMGQDIGERLHTYLQRYAIMFFDNDYQERNPMADYMRDFINRHRFRHTVQTNDSVSFETASAIFGVKIETLKTMSKRGLTRYYRRLAKKFHPDKGGSEKKFVELTNAYHALLKKWR